MKQDVNSQITPSYGKPKTTENWVSFPWLNFLWVLVVARCNPYQVITPGILTGFLLTKWGSEQWGITLVFSNRGAQQSLGPIIYNKVPFATPNGLTLNWSCSTWVFWESKVGATFSEFLHHQLSFEYSTSKTEHSYSQVCIQITAFDSSPDSLAASSRSDIICVILYPGTVVR